MIVSINQPAYLPWLGYFERIARSDVHVVLDHVQFEKNSFTNRNKICGPNGVTWLTVPVATKGRFGDLAINTLAISPGNPWAKKHWRTISMTYRKAPYFGAHEAFFAEAFVRPWERLNDLTEHVTGYLLEQFGIETKLMRSSEMDVQSVKSELVLEICRKCGADAYLSGALGRDYLEVDKFTAADIGVEFQDYQHPVYEQVNSRQFEPYMAAIDLLFNHGPESRNILLNANTADDE